MDLAIYITIFFLVWLLLNLKSSVLSWQTGPASPSGLAGISSFKKCSKLMDSQEWEGPVIYFLFAVAVPAA